MRLRRDAGLTHAGVLLPALRVPHSGREPPARRPNSRCSRQRRDEQFRAGGSYRRQPELGANDASSEGGPVCTPTQQDMGIEGQVTTVAQVSQTVALCRGWVGHRQPRQRVANCRKLSHLAFDSTTATTAHPKGCVCCCRCEVLLMNDVPDTRKGRSARDPGSDAGPYRRMLSQIGRHNPPGEGQGLAGVVRPLSAGAQPSGRVSESFGCHLMTRSPFVVSRSSRSRDPCRTMNGLLRWRSKTKRP